eukprot:656063-Alexandrium_andersonii.AAC.1
MCIRDRVPAVPRPRPDGQEAPSLPSDAFPSGARGGRAPPYPRAHSSAPPIGAHQAPASVRALAFPWRPGAP